MVEEPFLVRVLKKAKIHSHDKILAVCAGTHDQQCFLVINLQNVVISNLDYHRGVFDYAPYEWQSQDVERIAADDNAYDWCIVHAGLHHCRSPHQAMCEMLRVSRKGIVVVEARDSFLMRLAVWLGLTSDFETAPVLLSQGKFGGLRNSKIPNFVYRWTEREVWKTVCSAEPRRIPNIEYVYGYQLPLKIIAMSKSFWKRTVIQGVSYLVFFLERFAPRQGNSFGMIIRKDGPLQPWLTEIDGELSVDLNYLRKSDTPENYN